MEATRRGRLPRWLRDALACVAAAVVTVIGYASLLGWDQRKTLGSDNQLHGPYEAWQVAVLVAVLAVVAVWGGWRERTWLIAITMTLAVAVCFAVDGATDANDDGLWPIGMVLAAGATFGGAVGIGFAAAALRLPLLRYRASHGRGRR